MLSQQLSMFNLPTACNGANRDVFGYLSVDYFYSTIADVSARKTFSYVPDGLGPQNLQLLN